jgi:hypothetical protein
MKAWGFILTNAFWFAMLSMARRKIIFNEFTTRIMIEAIISGALFGTLFHFAGFKLFKRQPTNRVNHS